jgi:hypothetical protein
MLFSNLFGKKGGGQGEAPKRRALLASAPVTVSNSVKADLMAAVRAIYELHPGEVEFVYQAALRSIAGGRDVAGLQRVLMGLTATRFTERRAGHVARYLNDRALSVMTDERQAAQGLTQAIWTYSGTPCFADSRNPTDADKAQDAAHRAADREVYAVGKGLLVNRIWTLPGHEDGCRCVSKSLISGVEGLAPRRIAKP